MTRLIHKYSKPQSQLLFLVIMVLGALLIVKGFVDVAKLYGKQQTQEQK